MLDELSVCRVSPRALVPLLHLFLFASFTIQMYIVLLSTTNKSTRPGSAKTPAQAETIDGGKHLSGTGQGFHRKNGSSQGSSVAVVDLIRSYTPLICCAYAEKPSRACGLRRTGQVETWIFGDTHRLIPTLMRTATIDLWASLALTLMRTYVSSVGGVWRSLDRFISLGIILFKEGINIGSNWWKMASNLLRA